MAYPTILVDNAGSDSAASGAGPSTALTGSAASTDGTGTVVTLDGSPDLTNVAVDGSHVIFLSDATAGNRNFGKITAKDNGAKTVTVANAFGTGLSGKTWAIGGKRATIGSATSKKLYDNNGAAGDIFSGWIIELASGYTESLTATISPRSTGNGEGTLTLRGAVGGTRPILTWTAAVTGITVIGTGHSWTFKFLELRNTNAAHASQKAIDGSNGMVAWRINNVKFGASPNNWDYGIYHTFYSPVIEGCDIGDCATDGIFVGDTFTNPSSPVVRDNWVHGCGRYGIDCTSLGNHGLQIFGNIVNNNISHGIHVDSQGATFHGAFRIAHNDCYANGGDGLHCVTGGSTDWIGATIENNYLNGNTGWGINIPDMSSGQMGDFAMVVRNNGYFANGSGTSTASDGTGFETGAQTVAPPDNTSYGTAGNFLKGNSTPLRNNGAPTANIGAGSLSRSYVTIGALQSLVVFVRLMAQAMF